MRFLSYKCSMRLVVKSYSIDIILQNHLLVTGVTRQVRHMKQELFTLPEPLRSATVFCWVCVVRSLVFCVVFYRLLFDLLSFVMYVLRLTASDYPFGIFKLFIYSYRKPIVDFYSLFKCKT